MKENKKNLPRVKGIRYHCKSCQEEHYKARCPFCYSDVGHIYDPGEVICDDCEKEFFVVGDGRKLNG